MIIRNVEKSNSFRKRDGENGVEYEYVRTIVTNSASDDETVVSRVLPGNGEVFNYRGRQHVCDNTEISRVDRTVWEARIAFRPRQLSPVGKRDKGKDPLRWPIEIEWRDKIIETYPLVDARGRPFLNSAGDMLKDRPPFEISHAILTITRYEASYSVAVAMKYANKVNGSNWYGLYPASAKMFFPESVLTWVEEAGRYYWKVSYRFEIAPEGWWPNTPDFGKRCLVNETFVSASGVESKTGKRVKASCKDELGENTSDGEFLDGNGGQLSFEKVRKGNIQYISPSFVNFETADFNQLRLL